MINLSEHIIVIDGKQYVPFDIAQKAYNEVYDYEKNSKKFDTAMKMIEDSIKGVSDALNIEIDDKNSSRES